MCFAKLLAPLLTNFLEVKMFREKSKQRNLFEPDFILPDILPQNDWSFIFREYVYNLIDVSKFKHLYKDGNLGAPNKSVKDQISLLIFMMIEQLNWRQVENMFRRRIDWQIATCTELGQGKIDHTTLFKFFNKLVNDEVAYELFKHITKEFIEKSEISIKQQRTDSFFMFGWLKILSRYGLLKEAIRKFLQTLRKQKPGLYDNIKGELSREYLKNDFDLTEKDKAKANRKIGEMAQDIYRLIEAFSSHKQIKNYETFKIMGKIFEQQCVVKKDKVRESGSKKEKLIANNSSLKNSKKIRELTASSLKNKRKRVKSSQQKKRNILEESSKPFDVESNNEASYKSKSKPEIEIREKPVGEKIISSPHNPDAEYVKKRSQRIVGHKGFLTETCERLNEVQFITDVGLESARYSDMEKLENITDRLEGNDMKPEKLLADAGFVNGNNILNSAAKNVELFGPVCGYSQDIEKYELEEHPFTVTDFKVELDDKNNELTVLNCPRGNRPIDQKRSENSGKLLVHFNSENCSQCPFANKCPVRIGKNICTLTIDESHYAGAKRHKEFMENLKYRKEYAIRAGAESMINEVANSHGCRKSRHRREDLSELQLLFGALSCNVKRFMRFVASNAINQEKLAVSHG